MLSLQIRQTEKLDLYSLILKNVTESCGPDTANQTQSSLKVLQNLRDELLKIASFKSDPTALIKFIASTKTYISLWNKISQSFSFGKENAYITY